MPWYGYQQLQAVSLEMGQTDHKTTPALDTGICTYVANNGRLGASAFFSVKHTSAL